MINFKPIFRLFEIVLIISHLKLDVLYGSRTLLWMFRWVTKILPKYSKISKPNSRGEALRIAFTELGPIFIKLGQLISVRPDLFPLDIVKELTKLQDRVKPFPADISKKIIEKSLEVKLTKIFKNFVDEPIASASIAQVHIAKTLSGESIIIKVLRPNIHQQIAKDITVMRFSAKIITRIFKSSKRFRMLEVVNELQKILANEIDLGREAANASELRRNFKDSNQLYVPKIYWQWTRKSIIVMEKIHGISITDLEKLKKHQINIKRLAEKGVEIFFTQVFRDRFFHADMHPGNIFVSYKNPLDPKYIAVDFGIMGSMDIKSQTYMAKIFMAFFQRDFYRIAYLHRQIGWIEGDVDLADFADEIRILSEPIFDKPLKDISFGYLLLRLLQVGRKFDMHIQPQLLLFQKTLFTIEGLGKKLYPELNIWEIVKKYFEKWQMERMLDEFNPLRNTETIFECLTTLPKLPGILHDTLTHINEYNYIKRNAVTNKTVDSTKKWLYFLLGFSLATILALTYPIS